MRRALVLLFALVLVSCSSAGAPGAGEALEQLDLAHRAQVESQLRNVAVAEEAYFAENTTYNTDLAAIGVAPTEDVTVTVVSADASGFCAEGSHADAPEAKLRVMNGNPSILDGACPTS